MNTLSGANQTLNNDSMDILVDLMSMNNIGSERTQSKTAVSRFKIINAATNTNKCAPQNCLNSDCKKINSLRGSIQLARHEIMNTNWDNAAEIYDLAQKYDCKSYAKKNPKCMWIAAKLYLKAANMGHQEACYDFGCMLIEGNVVVENVKRAVDFIKKAKDHGQAQFHLGCLYQNGTITGECDMEKALELYIKAADIGSEIASMTLQEMYNEDKIPAPLKETVERILEEYNSPF